MCWEKYTENHLSSPTGKANLSKASLLKLNSKRSQTCHITKTAEVVLSLSFLCLRWREDNMNVIFDWQEQYLKSAERTLHVIKPNMHWTAKTAKSVKCLAIYQVMWLLITTVISNHHTIQKELLHVVLHTAISTLGVYQNSCSWRKTSILSDLALYLLFICNGRTVFLFRTSPTVNIFITSQSLSHKCSFHTKLRWCHCTYNTTKVDDSKASSYSVMSPRDPICAARPVFAFP